MLALGAIIGEVTAGAPSRATVECQNIETRRNHGVIESVVIYDEAEDRTVGRVGELDFICSIHLGVYEKIQPHSTIEESLGILGYSPTQGEVIRS